MSQPTGIAINNTHLLRAAMLFMVLGVIGPGLFQLKPPQWFGGSGDAGTMEMAAPATAPPKTSPDNALLPEQPVRGPALSPPTVTQPAAPPETSLETQMAAVPAPVTGSRPASEPMSGPAPGPAPESAGPAYAVRENQSARQTSSSVTDVASDGKSVPTTASAAASDTASATVPAPISAPPAQPEQPAIAARKARPEPTPEVAATTKAATPQSAMTASLASRTAKLSAIPGRSSTPLVVSRKFAKQIPESHLGLPVKSQKESFIAMTLPLILAANEEITQRRKAIERAVSRGDQTTVERWARLYRIESDGRPLAEIERQLLLRADLVPVSLALAQAAIESGWGTSRFALQGNALFGQWAWQKDAGLKPARASNSEAVVRSFPNLFGSVRAYMHNLNTHPRYAGFRARRHLLRGRTQADLGYQLSNFLDGYAEIGEVYVAKLKTLIRSNEFGQYEAATLR